MPLALEVERQDVRPSRCIDDSKSLRDEKDRGTLAQRTDLENTAVRRSNELLTNFSSSIVRIRATSDSSKIVESSRDRVSSRMALIVGVPSDTDTPELILFVERSHGSRHVGIEESRSESDTSSLRKILGVRQRREFDIAGRRVSSNIKVDRSRNVEPQIETMVPSKGFWDTGFTSKPLKLAGSFSRTTPRAFAAFASFVRHGTNSTTCIRRRRAAR